MMTSMDNIEKIPLYDEADQNSVSNGLTKSDQMDAGLLYTREIVDYEKSCRPTQVYLKSADDVKIGDHLHWKRAGSWRDGIVIKRTNQTPYKFTMFRYGYVFPRMIIREEEWELVFNKDDVYRYEYEEYCHPPSLVVARAKACNGQKGYNALRNNNDDFCRWSKSGKHTYLCVDETVLNPDVDTRPEEGTYRIILTSIDEMNPGDHICWSRIAFTQPANDDDDGWRHGIVVDNDEDVVHILGYDESNLTISDVEFDAEKMLDYKIRKVIYTKAHMVDEVIDRARYCLGNMYTPGDNKYFGQWCKTGIPQDADAIDTVLIKPKSETMEDEELNEKANLKKEAANAAGRSVTTSAVRGGVEGAVGTAARQVPRVLARGAAEGAAAAAAVGVEAVVLAIDVGLTYREFNRRTISKDELQKKHIQNTSRAVGAAGAAVGGGAAGAAIGTLIFPGIGTIVGGVIGGVVGGISGQVGGHFAGKGIAYVSRRPYDLMFVENLVVPE